MSLIRKEIEPVDIGRDYRHICWVCTPCHFNNGKCSDCNSDDHECDEFDTEGKIIKSYIWVKDGLEA